MDANIVNKKLYMLAFFGLLSCVISRAPLLLDNASILSISLNINAGYIVVFSPLILCIGLLFLLNSNQLVNKPLTRNAKIAFIAICLFSFFLLVQFTLNFSIAGQCGEIPPSRFFWDFKLYEIKPEYCFSGISDDVQNQMPYIYAPIQIWIYLALSVYTSVRVAISIREK
ncbi:MAG: hypothetical protein ABJH28_05105 [Paraglaciecola sp.]|uniref:hypothetical protein n=1 Tax=Paraglaciecola sp. TaxID=1920173 RepID=UPI0032645ACF